MRLWCAGTLGFLLVGCLWGGCKKDEEVAGGPGAASAAQNDALWALAPAEPSVAAVAADGSLARVHAGLVFVVGALEKAPGGAPVAAMLRSKLEVEGVNVLDQAALTGMGLDLARGAAVFIGKDVRIAVLPVGDAKKLVAHLKGSSEGGVDRLSDELFCKPIAERYVCADKAEALATVGKSPGGMGAWPADMRGHVEMFVGPQELGLDSGDEFRFDDLRGVRASLLLERGGVTARAHFMGRPAGQIAEMRSKPLAVTKGLAERSPAGVFTLQAGGLWQKERAKVIAAAGTEMLPGGATAGELIGSWTGEIVLYTLPGSALRGGARLGLSDPGPIKKLLGACSQLGAMAPAGVSLTAKGERCAVALDPAALSPAAAGVGPLSAELWAEPDALVIELGGAAATASAAAQLPAFGREVITGPWSLAFWGHGAVSPRSLPAGWKEYWAQMRAQPYGALSLWGLLHLNELGLAFQVTDDGAHLFATVRTLWSNPDDVVVELERRIGDFAGGKAEALDDLDAVAARYPSSPFANDLKAGAAFVFVQTGVLAAIAIPAFMKYTKKAKNTEARAMLGRMALQARQHLLEHARLPGPSSAMTPPAGSCCASGDKCSPDPTLWEMEPWLSLRFSVDDPHHYSYQYELAPDGKSARVRAVGDLDCDGVMSTFEMSIDPASSSDPPITVDNELE
jgi:hypothetical protein